MPSLEKLSEFTAWCQKHITGDEKGEAQIFLDRLFQSFGQPGCLDVGGATEFRIRKSDEDGGGTTLKPQRGLAYQPGVETPGTGGRRFYPGLRMTDKLRNPESGCVTASQPL